MFPIRNAEDRNISPGYTLIAIGIRQQPPTMNNNVKPFQAKGSNKDGRYSGIMWLFLSMLQDGLVGVYQSFDDMNLKDDLLRGIYAFGFEKPSAIQQKAIVPCIEGNNFQ